MLQIFLESLLTITKRARQFIKNWGDRYCIVGQILETGTTLLQEYSSILKSGNYYKVDRAAQEKNAFW